MIEPKNIKIHAAKNAVFGTTVEIDGQQIHKVKSISFRHDAGDVPVLTLEVFAMDGCEITGGAEVVTKAASVDTATVDQQIPWRTSKPA